MSCRIFFILKDEKKENKTEKKERNKMQKDEKIT